MSKQIDVENPEVKRDTVYKWIERKSLPAHKAGRLWRFKVREIDRWVRSGERPRTITANRMDK